MKRFMLNFMKDISSEIFVIYGLIGLVVGLIVIIVLFDRRSKEKRIVNRTQELRLMDLRKTEDDYTEEFKKQVVVEKQERVSEKKETLKKQVPVVEKEMPQIRRVEDIKIEPITAETNELAIDEAMYVEDDLEKTSAQIQLELLAQELEKAKELEEQKIRKFESDQEENAIISYHELLKVSDNLYDQNEKIQYMDEGNEPINLTELQNRFQQVTKTDHKAYAGNGSSRF